MGWRDDYQRKRVSVEDAVQDIRSGDRIGVSAGSSCPVDLLGALAKRYQELENVTIISGLLLVPLDHLQSKYKGHIGHHTLFVGPLERMFLPEGNIEVSSYQFSDTEAMTLSLKGNVAMFEVSPPDEHGYMSYGPVGAFNNDLGAREAETVIVQVNRRTPFVYGSRNCIHVSEVDLICEADHELPVIPEFPISEEDRRTAALIAKRIPDRATIQIGLGGLANAVGYFLEDKKDLGVHTEMLTDSMVALAQKGVITCRAKTFHPGKITCGFGVGSRALYDFMDRNPLVETLPIGYINDVAHIAQNDRFVSINNALCVDLTGQVGSESLGFKMYSGTGGQLDFVRGARLSRGGMSFIALNSVARTKKGLVSRITTALLPGTAVTTPRTDVHYIVTEQGLADLKHKSIPGRVRAMISIAHPDFREKLEREAREAGLLA